MTDRVRPGGHRDASIDQSEANSAYKKKIQDMEQGLKQRTFLFENPGGKVKESRANSDDVFSKIMRDAGLVPDNF